jgi:RNA polymerase primary sigma factor
MLTLLPRVSLSLVTVYSTLKKINTARKLMREEIGRVPSTPELAHFLEMSEEKLRKYTSNARNVISLEMPVSTFGSFKQDRRTLGDNIVSDAPTPEEDAQNQYLKRDIRTVINELADRERDVVILRFGLDNGKPMTIDATANKLGISRDRVRMVEARALNKLRNPQRNYRLKNYVGGRVEEEHYQQQQHKEPKTVVESRPSPEKLWFF